MVPALLRGNMGDRSEEATETRESRSTEDVLAETERLLSETGAGAPRSEEDAASIGSIDDAALEEESTDEGGSLWPWSGSDADSTDPSSADSRSRLSPGRYLSVSPGSYFSPKALLAFVLLFGLGLIGGSVAMIPFGRILGLFAVAFLAGLVTEKRRYLEVTLAAGSVGAISSLVSHAIIAVAGSGQVVAAVGASFGVISCVLGYYFGRDLRDGLVRDI